MAEVKKKSATEKESKVKTVSETKKPVKKEKETSTKTEVKKKTSKVLNSEKTIAKKTTKPVKKEKSNTSISSNTTLLNTIKEEKNDEVVKDNNLKTLDDTITLNVVPTEEKLGDIDGLQINEESDITSNKKSNKKKKNNLKEKNNRNFFEFIKKKEQKDIKTSNEEIEGTNKERQELDLEEIKTSSKKTTKMINATRVFMGISFVLMILMVIFSGILFIFAVSTSQNKNNPSFGSMVAIKKTPEIQEFLLKLDPKKTNKKLIKKSTYIQFKNNKELKNEAIIAYYTAQDDQYINNIGKIVNVNKSTNEAIIDTKNESNKIISINRIIGVYDQPLSNMSSLIRLFEDKYMFLYICVIPSLLIVFIMIISYMSLSFNKGANKRYLEIISNEEKIMEQKIREEKYVRLSEAMSSVKNNNLPQQKTYTVTEEKIIPLLNKENGSTIIQNENYYTDVVSNGNNYYQKIEKYKDSIARMKEIGAGDMDIIKVNMIGNESFDKLLNISRSKSESMNLDEIILFLNSLPDVHCIKKSGKINWTYKYKSKTLAIIREDANKVYRIAFKLYPDAANKINSIFMAFEDSNFPAGPYWYMVNNLRNIPIDIVKWSLEESYKISMFQQIKTDFLKEDKALTDFVSKNELKNVIDSRQEVHIFENFVTVIRNKNKDPKTTLLDEKINKLNINEYNKEFYFSINENDAISILLSKKASEALATAISNDLYTIIQNKENEKNNFDPFDVSQNNNLNVNQNEVVKKTEKSVVIKKVKKKK